MTLLASDFEYDLPPHLIAQAPLAKRTDSRLMVLRKDSGLFEHRRFSDLPDYLNPGDLLAINDTRVRPARLLGRKTTGARVELLLLDEVEPDIWRALAKPARRLPVGAKLVFSENLQGHVIEERAVGERVVRLVATGSVAHAIHESAQPALPPYIHETLGDPERYQTVYAARGDSVAAPTAGLHFTKELLSEIEGAGVQRLEVSLDIGLDTFRPIAVDDLDDHQMHSESYEVSAAATRMLDAARDRSARIVAVGTTTVRALESWARTPMEERLGRRRTNLFIKPGFNFMMTDVMLTNFHLPKSTLLVMVAAFAGGELTRRAYQEAIDESYRFFSFGDAMLII